MVAIAFGATGANLTAMTDYSDGRRETDDLMVRFTKPDLGDIKERHRAWFKATVGDIDPREEHNVSHPEREQREERFELVLATLGRGDKTIGLNRVNAIYDGVDQMSSAELDALCKILGWPLNGVGDRTLPVIEAFDIQGGFIVNQAAFVHPKERREMLERYREAVPYIVGWATRTPWAIVAGVLAAWLAATSYFSYQQGVELNTMIASADQNAPAATAEMAAELNAVRVATAEDLISAGQASLEAGQFVSALGSFEAARRHAARWLDDQPGTADALYHAAQPEFWIGETARLDGDNTTARESWTRYAAAASELANAEPDSARSNAEVAYATLNLSIMDFERGEFETALSGFEAAQSGLITARNAAPDLVSSIEIGNAIGWVADSQFAVGDFREAADSRRAELAEYDDTTPAWRVLNGQYRLAQAQLAAGQASEAETTAEESLVLAEAELDAMPDQTLLRQRVVDLLSMRAELALANDNLIRAKLLSDRARAVDSYGRQGEDRVPRASDVARVAILDAEVALASGAYADALINAENAAMVLREVDSPMGGHAIRLARAYQVLGMAHAARGSGALADRAWRQGLAALRDADSHVLETVYRARLLYLTGDVSTSSQLRASLSELGYADPVDAKFWEVVAQPQTSQRFVFEEDQDG